MSAANRSVIAVLAVLALLCIVPAAAAKVKKIGSDTDHGPAPNPHVRDVAHRPRGLFARVDVIPVGAGDLTVTFTGFTKCKRGRKSIVKPIAFTASGPLQRRLPKAHGRPRRCLIDIQGLPAGSATVELGVFERK